MSAIRLSVVIPTRNRPGSVLRLLDDLGRQTLPASKFEVLLVDDGSEPPLQSWLDAAKFPFSLRVIRRTEDHGAHESRFEGLRQAKGNRVLFLDDDLALGPEVLSEHAHATDWFSVGPILYHPESVRTPFQRLQAKNYANEAKTLERLGPLLSKAYWYICNSSGPTDFYLSFFQKVSATFGTLNTGDGFDEGLFHWQLRNYDGQVRLLSKALAFHIDNKTVAEACREKTIHGRMDCQLMQEFPAIKQEIYAYRILTSDLASYKAARDRLFWIAPGLFRAIGNLFTIVADRGPAPWIPTWVCRFALTIAYWEGVRSVYPSFRSICALLEPANVEL